MGIKNVVFEGFPSFNINSHKKWIKKIWKFFFKSNFGQNMDLLSSKIVNWIVICTYFTSSLLFPFFSSIISQKNIFFNLLGGSRPPPRPPTPHADVWTQLFKKKVFTFFTPKNLWTCPIFFNISLNTATFSEVQTSTRCAAFLYQITYELLLVYKKSLS